MCFFFNARIIYSFYRRHTHYIYRQHFSDKSHQSTLMKVTQPRLHMLKEVWCYLSYIYIVHLNEGHRQKNTVVSRDFLSGRMSSWQAHLTRISTYLLPGSGICMVEKSRATKTKRSIWPKTRQFLQVRGMAFFFVFISTEQIDTSVLKKDFRRKKRWYHCRWSQRVLYSLGDGEKIVAPRVNGSYLKIFLSAVINITALCLFTLFHKI